MTYRDTCAATCGQKNAPAIVNAPYYGLLLIQEALNGASDKLTLLGVSAWCCHAAEQPIKFEC
jgi:hypothetical protein